MEGFRFGEHGHATAGFDDDDGDVVGVGDAFGAEFGPECHFGHMEAFEDVAFDLAVDHGGDGAVLCRFLDAFVAADGADGEFEGEEGDEGDNPGGEGGERAEGGASNDGAEDGDGRDFHVGGGGVEPLAEGGEHKDEDAVNDGGGDDGGCGEGGRDGEVVDQLAHCACLLVL